MKVSKKVKIITKKSYLIEDEDEIRLLKFLLNYCYHRAKKHKTPVSDLLEEINDLRKQFSIKIK